MKIPPSPLYQRGVRGDFHASLWQQAMGVIGIILSYGMTARIVLRRIETFLQLENRIP
jgi:hypothetical protein